MKKSFFYLPLVAAIALTGCSKDDLDVAGENGGNNGPAETQYLAINVATTPDGGTRATQGTQHNMDGGLYEDGVGDENKVSRIRFFFFDDGQPVVVDNNEGVSFLDWIPATDGEQYPTEDNTNTSGVDCEAGNDEKILKALVVIETSKVGKLPTQVVAVVNPTDLTLTAKTPTLVDVRAAVREYANLANTEGKFVMSNSVYAAGGKEVNTTAITKDNYKTSADAALNAPVVIHVERTVAKVRVKTTVTYDAQYTDGSGVVHNLLKVKKRNDDGTSTPIKVGTQEIYLDIEGWNVTRTLNKAYLLKHIVPSWPVNQIGDVAWNDPDHYRSYWAAMCTENGNPGTVYGDFNHAKTYKLGGQVYATENGQHTATDGSGLSYMSSEIIIAGTLCDAKGNPLTVCELAGMRMLSEADLKAAYLTMLESSDHQHYWYDEANSKFNQITNDDIEFLTAAEASKKENGGAMLLPAFTPGNGAFKVYPCLTEAAAARQWYKKAELNDANKESSSQINNALMSIGYAKIWKTGKTYYYKEIGHLGGSYGVIRNHIYDMNINAIYGLGTPVYKPEEVIVPEMPSEDDSYVAAQLRILSWRVVQNDVTLDWGK